MWIFLPKQHAVVNIAYPVSGSISVFSPAPAPPTSSFRAVTSNHGVDVRIEVRHQEGNTIGIDRKGSSSRTLTREEKEEKR